MFLNLWMKGRQYDYSLNVRSVTSCRELHSPVSVTLCSSNLCCVVSLKAKEQAKQALGYVSEESSGLRPEQACTCVSVSECQLYGTAPTQSSAVSWTLRDQHSHLKIRSSMMYGAPFE